MNVFPPIIIRITITNAGPTSTNTSTSVADVGCLHFVLTELKSTTSDVVVFELTLILRQVAFMIRLCSCSLRDRSSFRATCSSSPAPPLARSFKESRLLPLQRELVVRGHAATNTVCDARAALRRGSFGFHTRIMIEKLASDGTLVGNALCTLITSFAYAGIAILWAIIQSRADAGARYESSVNSKTSSRNGASATAMHRKVVLH